MTVETSSVFGRAVDEFRAKLESMTASLAAACNEQTPTLQATVAKMMTDAAVQAIGEFAKDTKAARFDA